MLAKKSDYEHIVRSLCNSGGCELSDRMQGWRKAVVGDQLLSVANQHSREPPIIGINSEKINVRQICDIYKSSRDQELYVYVRFGAVLDDLPPDLLTRLGKPQKVMSITLTPERTLARVNVERVIQQVQEKGFYLQLPPSPFAPKTDD